MIAYTGQTACGPKQPSNDRAGARAWFGCSHLGAGGRLRAEGELSNTQGLPNRDSLHSLRGSHLTLLGTLVEP